MRNKERGIIMKELYLYHATYKSNLSSILKKGLLINPPKHNWTEMDCDDKIFLAFNIHNAIAYAKAMNDYKTIVNENKEEIILFRVAYKKLDENKFYYDWNNRCEYYNDIDSCVYEDNIDAKYLEVVDFNKIEEEPNQNLNSFKRTTLYNTILDVFDYEVETNMENF